MLLSNNLKSLILNACEKYIEAVPNISGWETQDAKALWNMDSEGREMFLFRIFYLRGGIATSKNPWLFYDSFVFFNL